MHRLRIAALLTAGVTFALAGGVMAAGNQAKPQGKPQAKPEKPPEKPAEKQAPAAEKPPAEKLTVHGGTSKIEKEHAFEVVFTKTGIKLYPYDMKGEPLGTDGLAGNASFTMKKTGDKPQDVAFKAVPSKDGSRAYLAADIADITVINGVKINVKGLKGDKEKEVTFDLPFTTLSPEVHYVCPKCQGQMADPGECPKDKVKLEKKTAPAPHS
jgi:hypothetical protein